MCTGALEFGRRAIELLADRKPEPVPLARARYTESSSTAPIPLLFEAQIIRFWRSVGRLFDELSARFCLVAPLVFDAVARASDAENAVDDMMW